MLDLIQLFLRKYTLHLLNKTVESAFSVDLQIVLLNERSSDVSTVFFGNW